jgi:hypothetical protein
VSNFEKIFDKLGNDGVHSFGHLVYKIYKNGLFFVNEIQIENPFVPEFFAVSAIPFLISI